MMVFLRDINRNQNGAVYEAAALLEFCYANDSAANLVCIMVWRIVQKQDHMYQHDCWRIKILMFYTIYSHFSLEFSLVYNKNNVRDLENLALLYFTAQYYCINRIELIKINSMTRPKMCNRNSVLHVHFKRVDPAKYTYY